MSWWWLLVGVAVFLIGVSKSGFGAGVGLIIVPMAVVAMNHLRAGPEAALGLMLPLLIIGDVIAVWQYRKLFIGRIVMRLLPGSILGILIGGYLLALFHNKPANLLTAFVEIEIGMESVVLVGLQAYRAWRMGHLPKFHPSIVRSTAVGTFAGISSTLAHAAGPIIALHLLPQRLDRQRFVGTCAFYFFIVNSAKVPVYVAGHQFRSQMLHVIAIVFPLVPIGAALGFWLTRKMSDRLFSQIIYAATFCLGFYLLYLGFGNLHMQWRSTAGNIVSTSNYRG